MVQYNFKIENEVKEKAEELSKDFENKQEFLNAMIESYQQCKQNNQDTDIDMSKYDNIESNTKEILSNAFKHIIYTIQANTTNFKQSAIDVEKEKLIIIDERKDFNNKSKDMLIKHQEEIKLFTAKLDEKDTKCKEDIKYIQEKLDISIKENDTLKKDLASKDKEIERLKSVNSTIDNVLQDNKELRSENKITKATNTKLKASIEKLKSANISFETEKKYHHKDIENLSSELENVVKNITIIENEKKALEKENIVLATKLALFEEKREIEK